MSLNKSAKAGLRERQRQARDEAIVSAAQSMIAENGYDAMTMDDLAERVGISKPTLYNYFPSKEAIVVRMMVDLMARTRQSIEELDSTAPAVQRLEMVLRWMISRHVKTESEKNVLTYFKAQPALLPIVRTHPDYRSAFRQLMEAIRDIIEAAQQAGDMERTLPSKVIAHMLLNLVRNADYDELIVSGEFSDKEIVDALIQAFFSGVTVRPR